MGRYIPTRDAFVNTTAGGTLTEIARRFLESLSGDVDTMIARVSGVIGVQAGTLAAQPLLSAGDAGYVYYVTDYAHLMYWTGAAWVFMSGDHPGKFEDFAFNPGVGYALCNGAATTYLTAAAAMTATAFTTPNLTGSPAYRKSAAAYSGAITAKSGVTGTGTTGGGTTGTGTSGDESSHTHGYSGTVAQTVSSTSIGTGAAGAALLSHTHTYSGTTGAGSAHNHSIPGLSVPGLSIPALAVGTLDMENLGVLPYVRR